MEETGFRVIRKARKRLRSESSEVDGSGSNESDYMNHKESSPERSCYPNGEYHCQRISMCGERSINEILKVVSLQSFSNARQGIAPSSSENGFSHIKGHVPPDNLSSDQEEREDSRSITVVKTRGDSSHSLDEILGKVHPSRGKRNSERNKVVKDDRYWEKRQRNNASAKRSRDARRVRELETQIRAEYLIDENQKLKNENESLRKENGRLQRTIENLELQLKNSVK